jgi:hypothetical protein
MNNNKKNALRGFVSSLPFIISTAVAYITYLEAGREMAGFVFVGAGIFTTAFAALTLRTLDDE